MDSYILAVDAGGSTLRGMLFDKKGSVRARRQMPVTSYTDSYGMMEHDPEELWQLFYTTVKTLLEETSTSPGQIRAMGITVQRATFTLWDKKTGEACCNVISWSDVRASETAARMNRLLKWRVLKAAAFVISRVTGNMLLTATAMLNFVTDHALCRLVWLFENRPDLKDRAVRGELLFGTLETWFLYKLSGGTIHATDISNAVATSLYNPFELKWNSIFCRLFSIPMGMLPEVRQTADDYGSTDASLFGGAIPVRSLAGDQMAALFGHCCFEKGMVKISQGTGSFVDINMGSTPKLSKRGLFPLIAWQLNGKVTYMLEGSVAAAGRLIDWLGQGIGISDTPAALNEFASQCGDSGGVIFVPTPGGIRFPYFKPRARASIFGLSLSTHRRHVARAVLEGIAFRLVDILEGIVQDTKVEIKFVRVDGGVSRSDILLQALADFSGYPVYRSPEADVTAAGAAFLAGLGSGFWSSLEEITGMRKDYDEFYPRISSRKREEMLYRWKKAVKAALSV